MHKLEIVIDNQTGNVGIGRCWREACNALKVDYETADKEKDGRYPHHLLMFDAAGKQLFLTRRCTDTLPPILKPAMDQVAEEKGFGKGKGALLKGRKMCYTQVEVA